MEATTINQANAKNVKSSNKSAAVKEVVKKVVIDGVPCVVIGGLAGMIAGRQTARDVVSETLSEAPAETVESTDTVATDVKVATSVTDEMTFAEAFAAARQEVGAGGAFEWRGTVYGTYYANEWDAMSSQEQAQFSASAIDSATQNDAQHATTPAAAEDNNVHTASHTSASDPSATAEPTASAEADVQVVDVMTQNEDGTLVTYTQAYVNGDAVIFAEVDGDDIVDVMITDANNNNELDQEDVFDISDQEIHQSHLNAVHEFNKSDNEHLAQLDDFENNAGSNPAANDNGELLACREAAANVDDIKVLSYSTVSETDVEIDSEEIEQSALSGEDYAMGSIDDLACDGDCGDDMNF